MPYCKRLSPSDDALAVFHTELARAAVGPQQAAAGRALWPRFAGYYQGLARLPRRLRRQLQRRWRRSLAAIALLLALGQAPALAATINVDGTSCTLVDAITAANNNQPTGGCTEGSGADTITLPAGSAQTLTSVNNFVNGPTGLPVVSSTIVIDGNGSTITRDPAAPEFFRILAVNAAGNLTLQETTVSGGLAVKTEEEDGYYDYNGGGLSNKGTLALIDSTISGNSADKGGGLSNTGTLTLINSTVSGNSAGRDGGGVFNGGSLTLANSTVSGNSARKGGGIFNARDEYNDGVLSLSHTVVSGNTASLRGREVYISGDSSNSEYSPVITDSFNLFGRNGISGVQGFVPGSTDIVPNLALIDILDHRLADNGGTTPTHALVFGSPAVDAVPAASCATATDQRGVTRPQDDNGDAIADCDIGAFEGAQAPAPPPLVEAEAPGPKIPCTGARCQVLVSCNLSQFSGTQCTNRIRVFLPRSALPRSALRLGAQALDTAQGRVRFTSGVANIPPGASGTVKLKLTSNGKSIVGTTTKRRLRGVMEIRNTPGTAISQTPITIRLKK